MNIEKIQQLLERLAGLLRAETRNLLFDHGLQPVQFEALHYLSVCNRYSDTLMGVTEYLGQTKGTVSQTLKALERKGLIEKTADKVDKRMARLSVTAAGHRLVKSMPSSRLLASATSQLNDTDMALIEASLQTILKGMQSANNFKTFGQCLTCRHHIKITDREYMCGLTKESLQRKEIELVCREHEPDKTNQSSAEVLAE